MMMRTATSSSSLFLLLLGGLMLLTTLAAHSPQVLDDDERQMMMMMGPRHRFWKHHVQNRQLLVDGVNMYDTVEQCLRDKMDEFRPDEDDTGKKPTVAGPTVRDLDGTIAVVVVQNAIPPKDAHAVQSLAACVRQYIPGSYESRAMYQEMNLDEDDGLGGNCPTHLAPLISIFLPDVVRGTMQHTLELAYRHAGWETLVRQDAAQDWDDLPRRKRLVPPDRVGMRASEHLTYRDFPLLDEHTDGDTAYTMNFAFSGGDDYQGGAFYVVTGEGTPRRRKRHIKPEKYDALVFLGGQYLHGVDEITGGNREMFSTEFWPYPDTPYGSNLWTNHPNNMETYIERCNAELPNQELLLFSKKDDVVFPPCQAEFPTVTAEDMDMSDVRKKYAEDDDDDDTQEETVASKQRREETRRPNRVRPSALTPIRVRDGTTGREYDMETDFWSAEDEPHFLLPKTLPQAEMVPIRWRDTLQPVDGTADGESFVIGFPPELQREFQTYIEKAGLMQIARNILYQQKALEPEEHRLYTAADGQKWGAMIQGSWDSDMVWLDPADEACFESLLGVLRRGNFDAVLNKVATAFDLNGLMIQGVGAIFLSEYEALDNMHVDIPGSKGSFYNIIVPVHIPVNQTAKFYVGEQTTDDEDADDEIGRVGTLNLHPGTGVVLGGESRHGTGECNYKSTQDFRLSFAIYVADIDEDNIDLIASDSTSLWPTDGDVEWFRAQQGRLWSKADPTVSLKNDKGRKRLHIQDKRQNCEKLKHLCEDDVQGIRLQCPKTCQLYLEDDVYYEQLSSSLAAARSDDCQNSESPSCATTTTTS